MAEYKVGSLFNLISGKKGDVVGPKIIYKQVTQKSQAAKTSKNGQPSPKSKDTSTLREKGMKIKDKLSSPFLKKRKPEIGGDNQAGAIGKSWKQVPNREEASETDGGESQPRTTYAHNAARRIHIKKNTKKHVDDPEREERTIFVGNIPYAHTKKKKLFKFFSKYGEVESVRFRCAPLKDPRMPKKVAVIKQEFHPGRSSICAYVVFSTKDEAHQALKANGEIYHDHHLRVDMAGNAVKKEVDSKRSVFIGNLAFSAEEEDLWELFSKCGPISSVRIIRDPITAVSKGVAFVNFESADAAELALQLDGNVLKKRNTSVKRHKPSAKPSSEKTPTEKIVRHKGTDTPSGDNRVKDDKKEKIRMEKKQKRKMRREGELMMGIVKKKKTINDSTDDAAPEPSKVKKKKVKIEKVSPKPSNPAKFQGQTIESSKKKKKKVNKGEMKKKKVAHLLGAGLQKKKKKV